MILSHFISNVTPVYGNRQMIDITNDSCMHDGASCNSLNINIKNHVGTHVDLPRHFDPNGKVLNDYLAEEWVFSKCQLLELPIKKDQFIKISHLEGKIRPDTDLLFIKTGFENFRGVEAYWNNNPGIDPEVGPYLRVNFPKLELLGFDFMSITAFQFRDIGKEAHRALLASDREGEPLRVIEDMKLSELTFDPKEVIVAPLMIDQADGIPVTVFAKI